MSWYWYYLDCVSESRGRSRLMLLKQLLYPLPHFVGVKLMQLHVSIKPVYNYCISCNAMQRNCSEAGSSVLQDQWTGWVMQQHTLNMATLLSVIITAVQSHILSCGDGELLCFCVDIKWSTAISPHTYINHTIPLGLRKRLFYLPYCTYCTLYGVTC